MSKICCFAGHSELYGADEIYENLLSVLENLITAENVTEFWVGNYGAFDRLCGRTVRILKEKYPDIRLNLVIPYLTREINEYRDVYYNNYDCILMADIPEKTPKRLQIKKCCQYMVQNSSFLVCFVNRSFGGAASVLEYAKKRDSLTIINLADY